MRKLESIQRIISLDPIPGADAIEKATVLGWELVVKKGEFQVGDLVVYIEIDSILPDDRPEFEFLRPRGMRIKTIRLRGQISQGICFPISILPENNCYVVDQDVTDVLGIKKHDPYGDNPVKTQSQSGKIMYPKWMPKFIQKILHRFSFVREYYRKSSGQKTFPSCIPKTDETRVQVLQKLLNKYAGTDCYVTEKLDGSSITIYLINGKFGVCSRNVDLKRDPSDKFWKKVIELNLESKMRSYFKDNVAIQGELIGKGIQGNKYGLDGLEIYFFNIFYIKIREYGDLNDLQNFCIACEQKRVPLLQPLYILDNSIPNLVSMSTGVSRLAKIQREGIVIRPIAILNDFEFGSYLVKNRVSFKVINPQFLLKYDQ